jgi:hypothetical protein
MIIRTVLMLALAGSALGCVGAAVPEEQERERAEDRDRVGTLAMNLTGTDARGRQYRLRNADFQVVPYYYDPTLPSSTTLSSETDPDAQFIEHRFLSGYYTVSLVPGAWYLERLTPGGAERVDLAVLLSEPSVFVVINPASTSEVYFSFGVDGEVIDFRGGKLRIGIQVQLPPEDDAGI